jgi:hypothetical protein
MPDPFEVPLVVAAATGGVADQPRRQAAVDRDLGAELNKSRAPISGMPPEFDGGAGKTGVPFDRAG